MTSPPFFPLDLSRKEEKESSPRGLWKFPPLIEQEWYLLWYLLCGFPFRAAKRKHTWQPAHFQPSAPGTDQHYSPRDTSPSFHHKSTFPHPFPPPLLRGARSGAVSGGGLALPRGASRVGGAEDEHLCAGAEPLTSAPGGAHPAAA